MSVNLISVSQSKTMSSLEIAQLTDKNHFDVLRDIKKILSEAEIGESKFAGTYLDVQNKERPCFNLPRRECDLVIAGYSVKYRLAIIDRWQELEGQQAVPVRALAPLSDAIMFADFVARHLNLSETSKLRNTAAIAEAYGLPLQLPTYTDEKLTRALGDLLKEHNIEVSAIKANVVLEMNGYLEKLERRSTGKKIKTFWSITESGLQYGKNETSTQAPNQTQPRWYVDRFTDLLRAVNCFAPIESANKNGLVALPGGVK